MNQIIRLLAFIAIISGGAGCSQKMQENVGLVKTTPNEYNVQTVDELEVPPHYRKGYKPYESSSNKQN